MDSAPDNVTAPRGVFTAGAWFYENSLDIFLAVRGDLLAKTNAAWTTLTGWERPEALGLSFWNFVHPDDREAARTVVEGLAYGERAVVEHRLSTVGGDWLHMRSHVVGGDEGWVLIIARNVTAERERERNSENARRTVGMLREAAGVTIWRYNVDADQFDINPDFTRPADGAGGSWASAADAERAAIHPEDAPGLKRDWEQAIATGQPRVGEHRESDGEQGWKHIRTAFQGIRPLPSGRWEILGIAQDVTAMVEARDAAMKGEQAALDAAAAKTQFLTNMSHEIRTPMNGVLGILHLLKREPSRKERQRLVDEALASGVGLSDLLNDIIDYSDVEAGRLEPCKEPLEPGAELESVLALLRPRAAAKGLALTVAADADLGWVLGDPARLRKMFFHLVSNAVKFTPSGRVAIGLSAAGDGDDRRLSLVVEDTGIGIAPEDQGGLFQHFNQVDGSLTRRFGGPGLGLAVTRRLAEIMGGKVGFQSARGEGSTFWVEVSAPACAARDAGGESEGGWLSGLRVLVVEDNPTNRLVATAMLGQLDAEVETADDGAEGVAAVERSHFDLIFMDIQMPVMDGVEATRRIRAMPEPRCSIPIVATTANVMPEQLAAYRQSGINGVVAKPISPTSLLAEVARIANDDMDLADSA